MSFFSTAEFKVGALVVSMGALIALMSLQVSDDPSFLGRSKAAWFYLPNANGLIKGSAIRSAGIPVGAIKDIRLQDGQARIEVTVQSDIKLTRSATVEMRANGILGDKYVEVFPGSATDAELEDGGQILNVKSGGSLDDVMAQVSEITSSLKEAVSNDGTNKHILGRIVQNIERLTSDMAQMTTDNKEQISEIVDQVNGITDTLDELLNDEADDGFKKTWKRSLARIDSSLKNIEEITDKINKGEGTIGKLVSDEKTAENVSSAIDGLSGLVDTANRMTTAIDFNGYYLNEVEGTKSSIGLHIQPGLDRYYYIGLVTDPAGVVEKTNTVTTSNGVSNSVDEVKTYKSKTKFTVLFAKNIYDFTLKGGLIENTGGVGIDYSPMLFNRLKLSLEAFDFEDIQMRSALSYKFKHGFYLTAGYNDILDNKDAQSFYGGAGLFLTNDDLKLLLTKSPF